nr:replication protein A 70 kDa DNA-binding subunit B-like [Ipomoea batatas]
MVRFEFLALLMQQSSGSIITLMSLLLLWRVKSLRSCSTSEIVVASIEEVYRRKELCEYQIAAKILGVESLVKWYYISYKGNSYDKKLVPRDSLMYCSSPAASLREKYSVEYKDIQLEFGSLIAMTLLYRIVMKNEHIESLHYAFVVLEIVKDSGFVAKYCGNLICDSERAVGSPILCAMGSTNHIDEV